MIICPNFTFKSPNHHTMHLLSKLRELEAFLLYQICAALHKCYYALALIAVEERLVILGSNAGKGEGESDRDKAHRGDSSIVNDSLEVKLPHLE